MILKPSLSALALMLLLAMPISTGAAGLGKLTVLSVLGQPLRAEVDLSASQEELASLTARLATPEAFKQAGIEYIPVLGGVRFTVDKRANGQPFLRLSSDRSINEPFLDILIEMSWSSGRLLREYTFLLDPPEALPKEAQSVPAVILPEAPPAAPMLAPAPRETPAAQPLVALPLREAQPSAPAAAPVRAAPVVPAELTPPKPLPKPPRVAEVKRAVPATRVVKEGDTLGKIALQSRPEGVSLDQMLLALFRSNEQAFDGGNINRLRAGRILSIPEAAAVQAVDATEAKKTVLAQAADFNAYRKKLAAAAAGAPVKEVAAQQSVSGKILPKVEDKAPAPVAGKDKLEVSKSAASKDAKVAADSAKRIASLEEDLVARGRALKEANDRIAALERNVGDLKKLMELKSQSLAQAQQQAQRASAAQPEPVKPETAKPEAAKAEVAKAEVAKAEAPKGEEAKPAAPPPKPAEPKPAVPKPAPPPPPPASFVDENPEMVYGGAGIVALLLAYLGYSARRRKKLLTESDTTGLRGRSSTAAMATNSVVGSTGGQSVDTSNSSLLTDFSQSGMAAVDSDEGVDPVAEADVYMAYGRDTQAEEILLEALKTDPTRHAIRLKLLEIYAARKSSKQFESVATELHSQTGGVGPDWEKAAILVQKVDPENPLYGRRAAELGELLTPLPGAAPEAFGLTPEEEAPALEAEPAPVEPEVPAEEVPMSLDFDLDLGTPESGSAPPAAAEPTPADDEPAVLDFDLEPPQAEAAAGRVEPYVHAESLPGTDEDAGVAAHAELPDVDLAAPGAAGADLDRMANEGGVEFSAVTLPPAQSETEDEPEVRVENAAAEGAPPLEFNFDLGPQDEPTSATAAPAAAAPKFDLSGIDLDLSVPAVEEPQVRQSPAPEVLEMPAPAAAVAEASEEVATKLELAHAYEEMGDKEGARELLEEVIKEGNAEQQETARVKLAQLG